MSETGELTDNVWRHWWAGHMRAVGAETRLPLHPLPPDLIETLKPKAQPRPRDTTITKLRNNILTAANRIISAILEVPFNPKHFAYDIRTDALKPPDVSAFANLEPIGWGLDEDWWLFPPEDCKPDLVWPINVGYACQNHGEDQGIGLYQFRTVTKKEVRGLVHRFSPYMVREDFAQIYDGVFVSAAGIAAFLGGEWVDADKRRHKFGHDVTKTLYEAEYVATRKERNQVALGISMALRQRYEWSVALGFPHSPSIRFVTDPTGIKDIFRLRDLPDGRDRRAALLTWVTDHWRQQRHDPDIEGYVRKHLRGAVRFTWKGLQALIVPSQFDVEQNERLQIERAAMRNAGTDQRRKKSTL